MTCSAAKRQKVCNKHWKGATNDIRFTRRKLNRTWSGCCALLATLLVCLLLITLTIYYLGYFYFYRETINRQTFRGVLRVKEPTWDDGGDTNPDYYKKKEEMYKEGIQTLYRSSDLRGSFSGAEILAFDSLDSETTIYFDVFFEPIFTPITEQEVRDEFERQFLDGTVFANVTLESVRIEKSEGLMLTRFMPNTTETGTEIPTTEMIFPEKRTCEPISLGLCSHLSFNSTSYPNIVGHTSFSDLEKHLVAFRELFDAECSTIARDFVCRTIQPECDNGSVTWPCRSYCKTFMEGCGSRLPEKLKAAFECDRYPELIEESRCTPAPDCKESLKRKSLWGRICDGAADCVDASDENTCPFCPRGSILCARHSHCISPLQICDNVIDCPDGSDEVACLSITKSLKMWAQRTMTLGLIRQNKGDAVWAERGRYGKVCATSIQDQPDVMQSVALSLCKALTFNDLSSVDVVQDVEETSEFADIIREDGQVSFAATDCPAKQVLRISCTGLRCGLQSARGVELKKGVDGLSRTSKPGDWPWHVALYRDGAHVCDATLIDKEWLITTSFCFQGQGRSSWVAKAGQVRTQSATPWQQERRIVGLLRSPVEGSSIALLHLNEPIVPSDFVRHICLTNGQRTNKSCGALAWSNDQLRRIQLNIVAADTCHNVSVPLEHSLCTEAITDNDNCDEEEFAGSSIACFDEELSQWSLEGISAWRIACRSIGRGRPRLYDDLSANVKWINQVLSSNAN